MEIGNNIVLTITDRMTWAVMGTRKFKYHDELPPTGEWPGGKRYGFVRLATYSVREWTDEEKARAYDRGDRLPVMWNKITETWWDQPASAVLTYDKETIRATNLAAEMTIVLPIVREHIAKPYGRWFWR